MNMAADIFNTKRLILTVLMIIFATLNPFSDSAVKHGVSFTAFITGAKAT
jgi:hypothetical protein